MIFFVWTEVCEYLLFNDLKQANMKSFIRMFHLTTPLTSHGVISIYLILI